MRTANPSATGIMQALKEQTRALHERVEASLGIMDPDLTLAGYRSLLERFWGFYAPMEARLYALGPWDALGLDSEARRKAPWLAADLRAMGVDDDALARLPLCHALPRVDGVAGALGCLYVMEGATLGGAFIARHLALALGVQTASGGRFFASYAERRGPMWKAFGQGVEQYTAERGGSEQVLAAARETFTRLDEWLMNPRA